MINKLVEHVLSMLNHLSLIFSVVKFTQFCDVHVGICLAVHAISACKLLDNGYSIMMLYNHSLYCLMCL